MNPFTPTPKRDVSKIFRAPTPMPDRVQVPGVEQEEVDALQEGFDAFARTRLGFLRGMIAKGATPYQGTVSGAEKARRRAAGKRQRAARKIARA